MAVRASAERIPSSIEVVPGGMLGRYELLATIGKGGMATIMLARLRGPVGFEKLVVIKAIHPRLAYDPAIVEMLRDEAQQGARIDHPNVVSIYELGEAHGTYFIAMEYLAGESLAYILAACRQARANLHPVLAARVIMDAAEGLHAAHELGIIHRDISPENLFVLYNGAVKVVDFGIAKSSGRITETDHGIVKGKYAYMSPEQIRNSPLDGRSDVFALGAVLWEALTQQRLFQGDAVAVLTKMLLGTRVRPSQLRGLVPRGLDEVVLRALEPDPTRRFQSAAELRLAIEDAIWHYRCDAKQLRTYMTSTFPDRMMQRQRLIAHRGGWTPRESGMFALDDDEHSDREPPASTSAATVMAARRIEATNWLALALWLGLVIAVAVAVALAIAITDIGAL